MNNINIKKIEKNFLSILLNSESVRLKYIPLLKKDDFSDPQNSILFQELAKIFETKKYTFDLTLFSHYLSSNQKDSKMIQDYLLEVSANYFSDDLAENYWNSIKKASLKRKLKKELVQLIVLADNSDDSDDIINKSFKKLMNILQLDRQPEEKLLSIHELMNDYLYNQIHHKNKSLACSTGFDGLDKLTNGFKPGELIILAARPSMGKTALSLNMVLNNLNFSSDSLNSDIIIFSLEMSEQQIAQRIAMVYSPFNDPEKLTEKDTDNVARFLKKLEDKNIYINSSPTIDVFKIHSQLMEWQKSRPIKLVVIDYLQLLQSTKRYRPETRNIEIGQWTRELKTIAQKLKLPILCISQLSRSVEKREEKRPLLSDLRDSGSIEQDADVVMFLYRETYYTHRTKDASTAITEPHEAEIIIAKNRNGAIGAISVMFNPKKTTFIEISD